MPEVAPVTITVLFLMSISGSMLDLENLCKWIVLLHSLMI